MRPLIALLLAACSFNASGISLPDGPAVGQPAPQLNLPVWLQAPPSAAQGWPAGKVVVLEFWETRCVPCIASIPHLNELANQFKDKPVQFITVTPNSEDVVRQFLKRTPINAWIGVGPEAGTGEDTPYRVYALPHTVIIDAHGRIALITDPRMLNAQLIQACLAGSLNLAAPEPAAATDKSTAIRKYFSSENGTIPGLIPGQYRMGIKPLFQVMIQRSPTNSRPVAPTASWTQSALTLQNERLAAAIECVYGVKPARIITESEMPREKYDFFMTVPAKRLSANLHPLEAVFAQAVAMTFNLTVKRETRDVSLLVLKTNAVTQERLSHSTNPGGKYTAFPGEAAATDKPLAALADSLEVVTGLPVLDETSLTNHYNFDLKWDAKDLSRPNLKGIVEAVNKLGLDLISETKPLEVIVIRQSP